MIEEILFSLAGFALGSVVFYQIGRKRPFRARFQNRHVNRAIRKLRGAR